MLSSLWFTLCPTICTFEIPGGFLEFQATHTSLCESKTTAVMSASGNYKCPPLTSMSQPCLPVSNIGPTKILPFLFLGSQHDALSRESMQVRYHSFSGFKTFIVSGKFEWSRKDNWCSTLKTHYNIKRKIFLLNEWLRTKLKRWINRLLGNTSTRYDSNKDFWILKLLPIPMKFTEIVRSFW